MFSMLMQSIIDELLGSQFTILAVFLIIVS